MPTLSYILSTLILGSATLVAAQNAQQLPAASSGRTSAASVVAKDKWLFFGGTVRTWTSGAQSSKFDQAQQALANSITVFDLNQKTVSDVNVSPGPGGANRLNGTAQTCEYDAGQDKIYCFGGRAIAPGGGEREFLSGIGVFNPNTNAWEQDKNSTIPGRWGHSSVVLNNTMYIFGGLNASAPQNDLWAIPFTSLNATQVKPKENQSPTPRAWQCTAALNQTAFLLVGGMTADNSAVPDAWIFNAQSQSWTEVTKTLSGVPLDRTGRACAQVGQNIVLYGGIDGENRIDGDLWTINNATLQSNKAAAAPNAGPTRRSMTRRQQSSQPGVPSIRVYPQVAGLNNYFSIYGGQTTVDQNLGEWVANDPGFYFFDTKQNGWVPDTSSLGSLVPATTTGSVDAQPVNAQPSFVPAATPPGQNTTTPIPVIAQNNSSDDPDPEMPRQKALAALLFGVTGLVALLGLCTACGFASKEARRVKRERAYARENLKPGERPHIQQGHGLYGTGPVHTHAAQTRQPFVPASTASPTTSAANPSAVATGPASTSTAIKSSAPLTGGVQSSAPLTGALMGALGSAPNAPHRSDSRRRAHSPLAPLDAGLPPAHSSNKRYKVLWAATPSQPDEIDASPGDIVEEKRLFADGWAMVVNVTNGGVTGMIPVNILEEIRS